MPCKMCVWMKQSSSCDCHNFLNIALDYIFMKMVAHTNRVLK